MIREGKSLEWLEDADRSAEELEYEHRLDISGSVFVRMRELGMSQTRLAELMGVDNAQVSRIVRGKQNITLRTLSRLEEALGFRLDGGFSYEPTGDEGESRSYSWSVPGIAPRMGDVERDDVPEATMSASVDGASGVGTFSVWDGGLAA